MQSYAYSGRSASGELVRGVLEGATPGAVADVLHGRGITPLDIAESRAAAVGAAPAWVERLSRQKIEAIDIMLFSRQLHTLLKAGVPIMRALAGIQESSQNKTMVALLRDVRESLDSGRELSSALSRHPQAFSPFYLSMVRVGEMTGMLDQVFLRLFHHLDFEKFMREQVKAALRYPTFVVVAMAIALVVINLFVIPTFAKVYKSFNAQLPLMTQVLVGFSDFMVAWWPAMLFGMVGVGWLLRNYVRTPGGRFAWDRVKLRLPVAGKIILKATLARFSRSLAMAMKSGVPVVQALTVTAQTVDNDYIASRVDKMRDGVERGESVLRTAISAGVFTPVVLQMVSVGEESGALDDLLGEIAEMYQREVEYELKTLSAQIEPILIVALGIVVLILALGVFLPIWDLGKTVLK
jgi:MSHA biogenesis protein MshG